LVVDDLVDAALTMTRLLRLMECDARAAHAGDEALRIAAQFAPDVVLLDLGLPGIDGYEVARRLRALPATARTHIIALSGYGDADACLQAANAGCDDHWLKPAKIEQLAALIELRRSAS
jgi:two-component system CheB/CheR fusion protein